MNRSALGTPVLMAALIWVAIGFAWTLAAYAEAKWTEYNRLILEGKE